MALQAPASNPRVGTVWPLRRETPGKDFSAFWKWLNRTWKVPVPGSLSEPSQEPSSLEGPIPGSGSAGTVSVPAPSCPHSARILSQPDRRVLEQGRKQPGQPGAGSNRPVGPNLGRGHAGTCCLPRNRVPGEAARKRDRGCFPGAVQQASRGTLEKSRPQPHRRNRRQAPSLWEQPKP